jgi:hypothetical protein
MKPPGWKKQIDSPLHATNRVSGAQGRNNISFDRTGWMSGHKHLRPPVGGEVFPLTSPFIELLRTYPGRDEAVRSETPQNEIIENALRKQMKLLPNDNF